MSVQVLTEMDFLYPASLKKYLTPLEEGRLLILSSFSEREKRISSERSLQRNLFVAAWAETILVPHAAPNSRTEHLCRDISAWKKPIYTLQTDGNANLCSLGAVPLNDTEWFDIFSER